MLDSCKTAGAPQLAEAYTLEELSQKRAGKRSPRIEKTAKDGVRNLRQT